MLRDMQYCSDCHAAVTLLLLLLQTPTDKDQGHGTHVAGIAVGSFPDKLLDQNGSPLPYQRGVAYEALLGAIKVSCGCEA